MQYGGSLGQAFLRARPEGHLVKLLCNTGVEGFARERITCEIRVMARTSELVVGSEGGALTAPRVVHESLWRLRELPAWAFCTSSLKKESLLLLRCRCTRPLLPINLPINAHPTPNKPRSNRLFDHPRFEKFKPRPAEK